MKAGTAWSIRGVDDTTREAALEAARRSGLSVAEWLRTVLSDDGTAFAYDSARMEADRTGDGIARLDRRLSEIERSSRDSYESLAEQIRRSRGAHDAPARATSVSEMVAALARELENPDERARALVEGSGAWRRDRDPSPEPDYAAKIQDLERQIADMGERFDQPQRRGRSTENLADVSARLNAMLARKPPAQGASAGAIDTALKGLEDRIDAARARLGPGSTSGAGVGRSMPMAARRPADFGPCPAARIHPTSTTRYPNPTDGSVKADPTAAVIDEIAERQRVLDKRSGPEVGRVGEAVLSTAIAELRGDISALAKLIGETARTEAEDEGAYFQLARRIDLLAAEAPLERNQLETIRAELHSMLEMLTQTTHQDRTRLDALGEEVSALIRAVQGQDESGPLVRLEQQLAELTQSVEANLSSLASADPAPVLGRLESRIEAIADRLDEAIAHASTPAAMDELKAEIAAVRHDVGAGARSDIANLEGQMRDLASRVDEAASLDTDPRALDELEAQISQISGDLEHSRIGGETLDRLEDNLAAMQSHLAENEQHSLEAARAAAFDAVREVSPTTGDDGQRQLVDDLKLDLEKLKHAAGDTGQMDGAELNSVNETVSQVLGRLTRLEAQTREVAEGAPEPSVPRATLPGAVGEALPADERGDALVASSDEVSGSQGENEDGDPQSQDPRQRRADFIAAARRAAQAAAAETQSAAKVGTSGEAARPDGPFKRIRRAIDGRKRTLLLAAAAIVIAIGAMQIYGDAGSLSGDNLITETGAAEGASKFQSVAAGSAVTPIPGSTDSALIAPVPDPNHDGTFAVPLSAGNRFIKQPPDEAARSRSGAPPAEQVGAGTNQPDPAIGSADLVVAAQSGDVAAAFEIATRYADGLRVEQDMKLARFWYGPAARGGVAVAQYHLGSFYERGLGGPKDLTKAADWYQRAADQGNINAMHNLAVLMSEGGERGPNHAKALQWFTAAANYGVADSQYNLGVIYARAAGPDQDLIESYKWFAVAAATGDGDAAKRRDEVAELLGQQDLGRARARFQAWAKKPALAEANTVTSSWSQTTSISAADRQALVGKIQILLADRGFDPGPSDGLVGPRTRQAVLAFQRQNGIATTGRIDRNLIAALSAGSY